MFFIRLGEIKVFFLRIFIKKSQKVLAVQEKVVPLQRISRNALLSQAASRQRASSLHSICTDFVSLSLGYGVMVTLQILVLPFLVRVRVPQQEKRSIVDFNN